MRLLAGAPFGLVREMRYQLGQMPQPFLLGQPTTQDLEDDFAERWAAARSLQDRARIEQDFLVRFGNRATTWESELRTELVREPRRSGALVQLIDGSDRAARFLENVASVLPTTGQVFPASANVGLPWTGPADALIARFRGIRSGACAELERMRALFQQYPATPTPRVCPTTPKPPTPSQQLPSGEPGGRPRTFLDDAIDWVKEKALALILVGAWGWAVYEIGIRPGDQPEPKPRASRVRRRHVPVRA